jgi:SAM-dependent methyltransferase
VTGGASGAAGDGGAVAYTFGDNRQAARRLGLLAEVFEPATRPFLTAGGGILEGDPADGPPDLAIDLGCGPGHTTRLLAEAVGARRTVGLDNSPAFVELAREGGGAAFLLHDVTRTPFPTGPADVLFCRFLLTHLRDPAGTIEGWASQLRPGGILLVEEVETIDPGHPVFAAYLSTVAAMLAREGQRLDVGPVLDGLPPPARTDRLSSRVATLAPPPAKAAALFAMNLRVWREGPYARSELDGAELDRLATGLASISGDPGDARGGAPDAAAGAARIVWGLRQIVYRRTP